MKSVRLMFTWEAVQAASGGPVPAKGTRVPWWSERRTSNRKAPFNKGKTMPIFTNNVTGTEHAIVGVADKGIGVHGTSNTSTGAGGVSDSGIGVHGVSKAGPGVRGDAENGIGVFGGSKTSTAVGGISDSGIGVHGVSKAGPGVRGDAENGFGVFGGSKTSTAVGAMSDSGIGVHAISNTADGVFGISEKGRGVVGVAKAATGVEGNSTDGAGLFGSSLTGIGVHGKGGRLAGFFEGDVAVTGDIRLANADCAEDFDVSGATKVEPGTVMVLGADGALSASQQAYDKRVVGVISGAGDYRPGIVLDKQQTSGNRQPIALMGKVFCKVDARYGAIEVGDLLTTSATPGHAMKANDPFKAFGAVIGKALRPLMEGQGLIPILIVSH
jgi:hypothetical protein